MITLEREKLLLGRNERYDREESLCIIRFERGGRVVGAIR